MEAEKTIDLLRIEYLDLSFGELPSDTKFSRPPNFDPESLPWPIPSESVEEAHCAYRFNRIPGEKRTAWMSELWRVLIPKGKCTIIVPYWSSPRAIQDPCSVWPPLAEHSFLYFTKEFRTANKHPEVENCDFEFTYGYTLDPETANRSSDAQPFWIKHYINAASDLQIVLTKRT